MDYEICSTSLEDLKSLEREFSTTLTHPSGNPEIRQLISKIADKVHREKNIDLRRLLLSQIASKEELVKGLLLICQESGDQVLVGNIVVIFREGIAAKTCWRPQFLTILYKNSATEILLRLLSRMFRCDDKKKLKQGLSNHAIICVFWVLSTLAIKDANFSVKVRCLGHLKLYVAILKHLAAQPSQLYSILQNLKFLSRNSITATILGREEIIPILCDVIRKLSSLTFGPKLKVSLEVLAALNKTKQNQILLLKEKFLGDLLDILCRHQVDSESNRIASKIAGVILNICLGLVPSKAGLQQFMDFGGIGVLRNFCLRLEASGKFWDRLLCRACTVLSLCTVSKPLPVDSEVGAITFSLPSDCQNIVVEEAHSDSTSRETTPESDDEDENEIEDQNDDDDKASENDFAESRSSTDIDENINDTAELGPVEQRDLQDIERTYQKFFEEYHQTTYEKTDDNTIKANSRKNYLDIASGVKSISRFVKVAYPDMIGATSPPLDNPEILLEKNRKNYRSKLIQNVRILLNERSEEDWTVVYDLDQLILEDKLSQDTENGNLNTITGNLNNDDEYQIGDTLSQENSANRSRFRKQLHFESRFECGNLRKAVKIRDREYYLILSPDVNSRQQHQWFYFQVSNMVGGVHAPYTFNIINYEKTNSQFNFGMQPVMFSVKEAMLGRPFWRRVGDDVCYFRNQFSKSSHIDAKNYMTVSFTLTFPHDGDICYFAYHYPYTYSRLMHQLQILEDSLTDERTDRFYYRVDNLATGLNGNDIPLVTITAPISNSPSNKNEPFLPMEDRRVVFLTARVHPGETNASWIMEGVLKHLTGDCFEARELRSNFVFKIVPMLNPEGTINGSHRCGLTGEDLNRRWRDPIELIHPEIFHTKGLMSYCHQVMNKDIFLFCDFHGHSRKKNVFLYGCSVAQSWWTPDHDFEDDPTVYAELSEVFSSLEACVDKKSCRYTIERVRESTARVVVWREFDVGRSYTLEASFCGCNRGPLAGHQISTSLLLEIGRNFSLSLLYLNPNSSENDEDEFGLSPLECRALIEKDDSMKITRLVISMPKA